MKRVRSPLWGLPPPWGGPAYPSLGWWTACPPAGMLSGNPSCQNNSQTLVHLDTVHQFLCEKMSILRISCRDQIPILHHKRLPDASPVQEIASLLEHLHRFVFHILRIGSVIVSQSPGGQVIAGAFQPSGQPGEFSPIQHTSDRFRINRPCQHQHTMTDSANHFAVFEELQGLILYHLAF